MNVIEVRERIRQRFAEHGNAAQIPLQRGRHFSAKMVPEGIRVDNLGNQPLLPWEVFQEATCLLLRNGGYASRGNAMNDRLGGRGLPVNSVEGHIAFTVYGKCVGDSVFRRVVPIAAILVWAGICRSTRGGVALR